MDMEMNIYGKAFVYICGAIFAWKGIKYVAATIEWTRKQREYEDRKELKKYTGLQMF